MKCASSARGGQRARRAFCPAGGDLYLDLQLTPGTAPVTLERAIERREYLQADYFARVLSADVVILTLGLDEVWLDRESGLYLNATPPKSAVARAPSRYCVTRLGLE